MTDTLVREVMQLNGSEKAKLIELLNESLLTAEQKSIEGKWATESQNRYEDYKAGKHTAVDYSEIKRTRN